MDVSEAEALSLLPPLIVASLCDLLRLGSLPPTYPSVDVMSLMSGGSNQECIPRTLTKPALCQRINPRKIQISPKLSL